MARSARLHEQSVCDLISDAKGIFAVVPNIEFAGFDVDCAVIATAGVVAFEVKSMLTIKPARPSEPQPDWKARRRTVVGSKMVLVLR